MKPRNREQRGTDLRGPPYLNQHYGEPLKASRQTAEITLDEVPSFTNTELADYSLPVGQQGTTLVPNTKIYLVSQIMMGPYHQIMHLSLNAVNRVVCKGQLPNFPLAGPYNIPDFRNNQDLCAVEPSGGAR